MACISCGFSACVLHVGYIMSELPERVEQLQRGDGTLVDVFMCTVCKSWAHTSADWASACCEPRACECGAALDKTRSQCSACRWAKREARELEIFEAATKVYAEDYAGEMVCVDDEIILFDGLEEHLEERLNQWSADSPDEPLTSYTPPRVYATRIVRHFIDAERAIEDALDDAFEGAEEHVDSAAVSALEVCLREWSREHLPVTYCEDTSTALVFAPVQEPA